MDWLKRQIVFIRSKILQLFRICKDASKKIKISNDRILIIIASILVGFIMCTFFNYNYNQYQLHSKVSNGIIAISIIFITILFIEISLRKLFSSFVQSLKSTLPIELQDEKTVFLYNTLFNAENGETLRFDQQYYSMSETNRIKKKRGNEFLKWNNSYHHFLAEKIRIHSFLSAISASVVPFLLSTFTVYLFINNLVIVAINIVVTFSLFRCISHLIMAQKFVSINVQYLEEGRERIQLGANQYKK